jgi:hypothetical protein
MSLREASEQTVKHAVMKAEVLAALIHKAAAIKASSPNAKMLLDEYQASIVTGFEVPTLRKRRWQGLPPQFLKIGSKVRYDYFELERFIHSCVRSSTTDSGGK